MWFGIDERGHFRHSITSMKVEKSVWYHCEKLRNWVGEKMVFLQWGFERIWFYCGGKLGYDGDGVGVEMLMMMKKKKSVEEEEDYEKREKRFPLRMD